MYNVSLLVTSDHGCTGTIVKPITVYPTPVAQFTTTDTSGCGLICTQFIDTSIPLGGTVSDWLWDFGDGSPAGVNSSMEHCYTVPGAYTISLSITTSNGCTSTETKPNFLNVYPFPVAAFNYSPQPVVSDAPDVYFNNLSVGSSSWLWNFDDKNDTITSHLQFPTHSYSDTGNYCPKLIVQNIHSCFDTVIHCLEITPEFTFYIPNSFTPDTPDGLNDQFTGFGTFISKYDMYIFDRWGNMIFYTDDIKKGWDGRANHGAEIAQQDVYVYLVELKDLKGNKHTYRGTVTLIR